MNTRIRSLPALAIVAACVAFTAAPPAGTAGAVAVSSESETTATDVAATPPNETPVAPVRPVPVTVTGVPPACGPNCWSSPVTVGTPR